VQNPASPGHTAVVLRGNQGVGKGFLARTFGKLFGRHFLAVSNSQHLTGNFNAHLRDCVALFCDEAFFAGDKKNYGTLKSLVTEDSFMVEPKGVDQEMVANCLHIMMASNEDWVVPAGYKERRFCVLDVSEAHMQDGAYFRKIAKAMKDGGYASLLAFLLAYDLSEFNIRNLPQTQALQDQKMHSFEPVEEWWYHKLREGKVLTEHEDWKPNVLVNELLNDFVEYARSWSSFSRRSSATRLGHFLRRACPGEFPVRWQGKGSVVIENKTIQRPYYYRLPSLEVARKEWDERFGGPYTWPTVEEEGEEKHEDLPF